MSQNANSEQTSNVAADATVYSIIVLDVEGFSPKTNPVKGLIRKALGEMVREAVVEVGPDWPQIGVNDTGDGMLLLFPPSVPPAALAGPLLHALGKRLLAHRSAEAGGAVDSAAGRIRLRVSLNLGLAHPDGEGWYGEAVDFAFRLVESQASRDVLAAAERSDLVFVVSDEVYRAVIRHGYRSIDPAAFGPFSFDVKTLTDVAAWVYAPGYPFPPGLPKSRPASEGGPAARDVADSAAQNPAAPNVNNVAATVQGNQIGVQNVTVHTTGPVRF